MDRPEDNLDLEQSIEKFKISQDKQYPDLESNLSADNIRLHQRQLKSIILRLAVYGLVAGVFLSIVAVVLLEGWGLTNRFNNEPGNNTPKQQQRLPRTEI